MVVSAHDDHAWGECVRRAYARRSGVTVRVQRNKSLGQGCLGLKRGQDSLYLFGELSRLANRLPAQITATAKRD
jgi:hypothetical protein